MKILSIKNNKDLNEVINFLGNGLKWSLKTKEKIKSSLIFQNKNLKNYGYFAFDNNNILGAILIFHQGNIFHNKKFFKIINISSWYFLPSSRGGLPLMMIKNIIKNNDNSIITDLTPTVNAQKILNAFKFKRNNVFNSKINIFYLFIKNLLSISTNKKIYVLKKDLRRIGIGKNYFLNNLKQLDLKIGSKILSILYTETFLDKDLKIFTLKPKRIRVLWTSNYKLYSKHFFQINLFILLKRKSLFCTTHCKLSNNLKYLSKDNNQLIFTPKDFDIKKLSLILSLGSELNFI